jgi:hypothetical protein
VLGGSLFDDKVSRVYLLSRDAEVFLFDLTTNTASEPLLVGPDIPGSTNGHSGLTGPLTHCESGFVIVV